MKSAKDIGGANSSASLSSMMDRWTRIGKRRLTANECEDIDGEVKNSVRQLLSQIQDLETLRDQCE